MISSPFIIIVGVAKFLGTITALTVILRAYLRHRGESIVTCP